MAERVRFELTEPCGSSVFKTDGLNHSPTSPIPGFVCIQLTIAVAAHKPQILDSVVIINTVNMIQN